jgi:methylenetetrahydrofolate dehydrogenase (NADP+)/methenyltetrahydrofolate cyclohydrolase
VTANLMDGKALSKEKREKMKQDVEELKAAGVTPGLAVLLVGNNPASRSYVKGKQKACAEVGVNSVIKELPESISEESLLSEIERLNHDNSIHGILVQLPLPNQINELAIIEKISPEKDVDGFHPINIGRMVTGKDAFLPCTPAGIIELVKAKNIDICGKHVVIIGRSNIVGKPVGQLFLRENATVTICHSKTSNMKQYTKQADILVAAIGKPGFVTADYIREGAVVIDVGINRLPSGKLVGDVLFDEVKELASFITPVPGGVGPMTITMLLHNTIQSARKKLEKL